MNSKTLITGWNGFFGSILCKAQESSNVPIIRCGRVDGSDVICNLSSEVPNIPTEVTRVIHAAGVTPNATRPLDSKDIFQLGNVVATQNLLSALNPQNIESFVLISSVSVYGAESGEDIVETTRSVPTNEYGKSKLAAENLVISWCREHRILYTVVRLPLVVGPGAPGTLGQLINAIRLKRFVLPGKGDAKKSMVLASDVAEWISRYPTCNGIFNLTDQRDPCYSEICDTISSQLQLGRVPHIPLSIMKMASWLGEIGQKVFQKPLPYNRRVHIQITKTLTFSSKAAELEGWAPRSVLSHASIWLPQNDLPSSFKNR